MGENDIKDRWELYFQNLFNQGRLENTSESTSTESRGKERTQGRQEDDVRIISREEVKEALRKMGRAKSVGTDKIPIEVWKCLGDVGAQWLTTLFNTILYTGRMPDEWRSSVVIPIYKNKGDAQEVKTIEASNS